MGLYLFFATGSAAGVREWGRERMVQLAATAGYRLDRIYIEGRTNISKQELRDILNMKVGDPLFAFDPDTARAILLRMPWIKDAQVRRHLPNTIYVSITERTPIALWQQDGKVRVIDTEGVTLTRDLRAFTKLPLVVGQDANIHAATLLSLLAAEPTIAARVDAATWVGNRRWDLNLRGGTLVKLPEDDAGLALKRLADTQLRDMILDKDLAMIDLREPERTVVRTRPGVTLEHPVTFKGSDKEL